MFRILVLTAGLFAMPLTGLAQDGPDGFATGLEFMPEEDYEQIAFGSSAMLGDLPSSADLSEWFPVAGDQSPQQSCVGWAVGYGLKTYQEARERGVKPSAADAMSPSFVYNQIPKQSPGCGPTLFTDALSVLQEQGTAPMSAFPYVPNNCTARPDARARAAAAPNRIASYRRVPASDAITIKSQLAEGFPLIIGMLVDRDFYDFRGAGVFKQRVRNGQGHAMVLVGYDDSKGAYKVFNSWGTQWGDKGFGWVDYDTFERYTMRVYVVQDLAGGSPAVAEVTPDAPAPVDPQPEKRAPTGTLTTVEIVHNQRMTATPNPQTPPMLYPGMVLRVQGSIDDARGSEAQLIVRFFLENGRPLVAHPMNTFFRDTHGVVAIGTPVIPVGSDLERTEGAVLSVPYPALNLRPTSGRMTYRLYAEATLYVDGFEVARSQQTPFMLNW